MIIEADYEMTESVSDEAKDLIKKMLQPNPNQRLTIPEIFAHPWMNNIPLAMEMFTDEERVKIKKEFTFNDCNRLNRNKD
jgi:calcium-dependent protein kinase